MGGGSSRYLSQNGYNEETGEQVPNWPPEEDYATFFRLGDISFTGTVAVTHGDNVDKLDPFYIFAHELGHSTFGFMDLYAGGRLPEPIWFTLYGGVHGPHHLDPFQRFKMGWLEPDVVEEDGWFILNDVETTNNAYILHDPNHGTEEYFIVENRWAGTSYDNSDLTPPNDEEIETTNIEDEGLVLWHVDESRAWNGNNSGGISKLQLVPRSGQYGLGNYGSVAFNSDDPDYYHFFDLSTPANAQFWGEVNSNIGVWYASEAGKTMEAYLDVPGPGFAVYPKTLNEKAVVNKPSYLSVGLVNTEDLGAYGSHADFSLQGLDDSLFDYELEQNYPLYPKEPVNYTFPITPIMDCDDIIDLCRDNQCGYNFNLSVLSKGMHYTKSQEIPVTIELVPGEIELSLWTSESVVRPKISASYDIELENFTWDKRNLELFFYPIPLSDKYKAYPEEIQPGWLIADGGYRNNVHIATVFGDYVKPCGEGLATRSFSLNVPGDSCAAIEDAVYEFWIVVVEAVEGYYQTLKQVRGQITIKATAQSVLNYMRYSAKALKNHSLVLTPSLQAKAKSIVGKAELAILKKDIGKLNVVENILAAAKNKTDAYINEVEARAGKSIRKDEALVIILEAQKFKSHVDTAIEMLPVFFDIGDVVIGND